MRDQPLVASQLDSSPWICLFAYLSVIFLTISPLCTLFNFFPFVSDILTSLCQEFLSVNVSAILYLMNYETYGRSTASAQYFLQLAGYLGIPVIAWNADNSGLERVRYICHITLAHTNAFIVVGHLSLLVVSTFYCKIITVYTRATP